MKQKLLDILCTWIGHDWREKDDPNNRICLTCGALKSAIDGHPQSLPKQEMHASPAGDLSKAGTEKESGEQSETPTNNAG